MLSPSSEDASLASGRVQTVESVWDELSLVSAYPRKERE